METRTDSLATRVQHYLPIEQWLILLVAAIVLSAGIGWGLPNAERIELLVGPHELTSEERKRLTSARTEFYDQLESAEIEAAAKLSQGTVKNLPERAEPGVVLTLEEKQTCFRGFVLGSSAFDERKPYSALSRMNPAEFDFDPRDYTYGGAYIYLLGALLKLADALGATHLTSQIDYYLDQPHHAAGIYKTGRLLGVLSFLGVLVVLGRWSLLLSDRLVGTFSMLAWSLSTLPLNQALISKPHVYAAFFGTAALYSWVQFRKTSRRRYFLASAVSMGWATGASLPAGSLLLFPLLVRPSGSASHAARLVLGYTMITGLIFVVTNPYAVFSYERYLLNVLHHGTDSGGGWGYALLGFEKLAFYARATLLQSYAFPLSLLGLGSALVALRNSSLRSVALAWLCLFTLFGLFIGIVRITVFLGPVLCLFTGVALANTWRRLGQTSCTRIFVFGSLFAIPAITFCLFVEETLDDHRWLEPTRRWVANSSPANDLGTTRLQNASVGLFDPPSPVLTPPFPFLDRQIVHLKKLNSTADTVGEFGEDLPTYIVLGVRDRDRFTSWPHRSVYELEMNLGHKRSLDFLRPLRTASESRICGWVYRKAR